MARKPTKHAADSFTALELEVGARLPARSVELLVKHHASARPIIEGRRGKGPSLWDTFGLGQTAISGAFYNSGLELLTSARLADAIADELGTAHGDLPSNLAAYLRKERNSRFPDLPWVAEDGDHAHRDAFWLHRNLRTRTNIYEPRQHVRGDFYIEIADRQYVFTNVVRDLGIKYIGGNDAEPAYRIHDLERGGEASISRVSNEAEWKEFLSARENAVGILTVNISLAIRNAFDEVYDYRVENSIEFDWSSTIKKPAGRYDGCDANGHPLDPEHPWNRDLPPLERAKRLLEIEEYIDARDAEKDPNTS